MCIAVGGSHQDHLYIIVLLTAEPVRKPGSCPGKALDRSLLETGEQVHFWHHTERGKSNSFLKWFDRGTDRGHGTAVGFTLVTRTLARAPHVLLPTLLSNSAY